MKKNSSPAFHTLGRAARAAALVLALHVAAAAQGGLNSSPTPTPPPAPAPTAGSTTSTSNTAAPNAAGTVDANGNLQPAGSVVAPPAEKAAAAAAAPAVAFRPGFPLAADRAQPVRVPRFESAPVIDGKLDDAVWQQAAVFKDFYQIGPGDNIAPSRATLAYVGYDAHTLYFAFRCFDEPGKVRATVARRDNVFGEDNVRIYLDTFNDQRKAYVLGFNPLGVQQDGIFTESGGTDYSVDIVMESKGALTSDGYVVEVAIPFKSLRYEAGKSKLWGLHVWRNIDRFNDEIDSWMPFSRDNSGTLNQAGHLTGLEGISTERTIELIPSLTVSETGKRARSYVPGGPERFVNQPVELDPGLTAKFGISPTMTLDLALNPDFAQVEADQLVVTTNQRFPIFYPERRPFFLEGIEIFRTPITAVHTRAIVDPDAAVKLTGRRGPNTYGVMLASDNGPGNFTLDDRDNLIANYNVCRDRNPTKPGNCADPRRLFDKNAYIAVLRLKRDVGRENSVGLIATSYNFIEKHNQLFGLDGRFRPDPKTTITFQTIGTTARNFFFDADDGRTSYRTGNGLAYTLDALRQGRNFVAEFYGEGYTKDYRADVGFVGRTNTNFNSTYFAWNSTQKPKARLVSWHAHNFTHIDYDFQKRMQIWESEFAAQWAFQGNKYFGVAYEYAWERLFEEEFGPKRLPNRAGTFAGNDNERSSSKNHYFVNGSWRPSKKYSLAANFVYRDGHFDLDFGGGRRFPRVSPAAVAQREAVAAGRCKITEEQPVLPPVCFTPPLDPGPGGLVQLGVSATYQPTNELNTSVNYTKNSLRRYDTDLVAFDVNLISWRTTYQFTRFTFARARIDYETLPRRARAQFLLGYTPNPGTAFYVGYNDDANVSGFSTLSGQLQPGFRRNGRTFFIKASYLFRRSFGG
ncbi:MAG TPA: DUF5916 domain-containing protein [Pyrinomonadaceae bacterium]|jgi:hypothetical protein